MYINKLTVAIGFVILASGLLAQTGKPTISSIANVASYTQGAVSPGEMVVIFGSGMGPSQLVKLQLDANGRVSTTLSSVQVLFDDTPAPLIYVSQSQIAAMVPYGVSGKSTTQVQVTYTGAVSDAILESVTATAPGIFSADSSGKGQGAISNADGSVNSSANPAASGSYVTLYLTGEGLTNPPGSDGNVAAGVANVKATVFVLIAGQVAQVLYAGSAPGNVNGFAQVNVVIPTLPYGGSLPLVVQIGTASSQAGITLAVAGPPPPLPGPPVNVSATINSSNQVTVAWTPADGLATGFHVERSTGLAGTSSEIGFVVAGGQTSFLDTNTTSGTSYQYRVRAESSYGYSGYSAVASVLIPSAVAQPSPPTNVQGVAVSQTQISLTWSGANTNALTFQIERKTGPAGTYSQIATVLSSTTTYQDLTVTAGTVYVYRMRSQGIGISGYSNEATVTTPAVPMPLAPILSAVAISSVQIHLSWGSVATGIVRFRIERGTGSIPFTEINQPGPSATSFDDFGLSASTTYMYRMRVETGAGLSAYSNVITVSTTQGLPAAPTNLTATATSSTQVNLTWANNAPDAIAIRVEYLPPGSGTFEDIFAAGALTNTSVTSLQPNTSYSFRVRAQNAAGYSGYSNVATVTTVSAPKTVFLVHGLNQTHFDMQSLAQNLASSYGLTAGRFNIDYGFDFSDCVLINLGFCNSDCTIPGGAQRLAQYIVNAKPPGDIVVIGFSLGGLLVRDMMVNNRINLNGRKISLVTIGTPNVGYPYLVSDNLVFCSAIVSAMNGNWRSNPGSVVLSPYLSSLTNQWSAYGFPGNGGVWFAASGRAISPSTRLGTGCRDQNPYSDGVVCQDSAGYSINTPAGTSPNYAWADPSGVYVHSFSGFTSLILGDTSNNPNFLALWNPPPAGGLFTTLTAILDLL